MNRDLLKESLSSAPETAVKVNVGLHQDIMRAVRLTQPAEKKVGFHRVLPAMGAAVVALFALVVVFYPAPTTTVLPVADSEQVVSESFSKTITIKQLTDNLVAFTGDNSVPEQELRKELERLKSDLERFDIRS